eukprot:11218491-Lingulodinium_polyedra.AAC.1
MVQTRIKRNARCDSKPAACVEVRQVTPNGGTTRPAFAITPNAQNGHTKPNKTRAARACVRSRAYMETPDEIRAL